MKSATVRPVTLVPINLQQVQRIYEDGPEEVINFECKGKQGIHLGTAGNLNLDVKYVKKKLYRRPSDSSHIRNESEDFLQLYCMSAYFR